MATNSEASNLSLEKKNSSISIMMIGIFFLAVLGLGQAGLNRKFLKPLVKISKQESAFNLKNDVVLLFNLGQKRLLSSWLWVLTLIEGDIEHYKGDPLNNWMFHRFNLIIELEPKFISAYKVGGQYLSIVKDDPVGAQVLLDAGFLIYPDDYWLNFLRGYNSLFEMGQKNKALESFKKMAEQTENIKSMPFIESLIMKIVEDEKIYGEHQIKFLDTSKESAQNKPLSDALEKKIEEVKKRDGGSFKTATP